MLIDCSYFTAGSRHILNASLGALPNPNAVEVNEALEGYIAELQPLYLDKMLGSPYGSRVNAYLVSLEKDERERHNDVMDAICERLRESFADYVFFHILRESNTQATMTGLVQLKSANTYVSPLRRQVNIWNMMVERNRHFVNWAVSSEGTHMEIKTACEMLTKINTFNI